MAHLDYSTQFQQGRLSALFSAAVRLIGDWLRARIDHHRLVNQQWEDRQAFLNLQGKEEWVYRDMGISRGDVNYLASQPLHVNAARALEQLRATTRDGR